MKKKSQKLIVIMTPDHVTCLIWMVIWISGVVFYLGMWFIFSITVERATYFEKNMKIREKRTEIKDGNTVYLIIDDDHNHYYLGTSLIYTSNSSTELYSRLIPGKNYNVTGHSVFYGYGYPKIITAKLA